MIQITAIAYAVQLFQALPGLIQAGADIMDMVTKGRDKLIEFADQKRDPTPAEWDELNASISAKRKELHAP